MSIKKKLEKAVEDILKNYTYLKLAREIARNISQEEYTTKCTGYSTIGGGNTNVIHSAVEEYSGNKIDAAMDRTRIDKIIADIDRVLEKELSKREKIVIENFLIRNLDIEEVNKRLESYCNLTFERTTIYRIKKGALAKFVAGGIANYKSEIEGYLEQYL